MAYVKTNWVDRAVQNAKRYVLTLISGNTYDIDASPGTITNAGTAVTASRMNNIEQGIYDAHSGAYEKELLTAKGDIMIASAPNTPVRLPLGTAKKAVMSNGIDVAYGYPSTCHYTPSDTVLLTMNTERFHGWQEASLIKSFKLERAGKFRVRGEIKSSSASYSASVYIKNLDTGTFLSGSAGTQSTTYVTFSFDVYTNIRAWDTLEIWGNGGGGANVYIRNVTICADETPATNVVLND